MSNRVKATILSVSLAVVVFVAAGGLVVRASSNDGAYRQLGVYSEVLSRIRSEYVEEPNIPQVTDGALHGLLESLDANSSYLSASEYTEYKSHQSGAKADIGAAVSKRFGPFPLKTKLRATDIWWQVPVLRYLKPSSNNSAMHPSSRKILE